MPLVDMPMKELLLYEGRNPRPKNFDKYWENALIELKGAGTDFELVPADFEVPFGECFHLYFTGVKGARIHAKYFRPKNAKKPHPAMLMFHGYTWSSGDWSDKLNYIAAGYSVACLDCRGQGGLSEDRGGVTGNTHRGHIIRGLYDKPEDLLYRQIFLDAAQLAAIVMKFPEVDENRIGALGESQGGALTLACAALEPRIKRLAPLYPFLCDYKRIWEMDDNAYAYYEIIDYFKFYDPLHEKEDEIFTRLGYIDVQFLAGRIKGEVLMGVGLMDNVCLPSSQFAAYNKITSPKKLAIYPDFGHEKIPGFADKAYQFMLGL